MAADEPRGDRFAQRGRADRRGIIRQPASTCGERVEDERRRRMPRLADRQIDRRRAPDSARRRRTIAAAARTDTAADARGGDSTWGFGGRAREYTGPAATRPRAMRAARRDARADRRCRRRPSVRRACRGAGASRPGSRRRPAFCCWVRHRAGGDGAGSDPRPRRPRWPRWRNAGRRRSSRRRCSDATGGARGAGRRHGARRCPGDARLLGVFAEANGAGYALFRFADRGPVLVKAGAEIASGVTLVAVRPGGVRIRDHGEVRDLELRTPRARRTRPAATARQRAARAACAPPAGYQGPVYRLNAELLTGIASQPESWKALLAPVGRRSHGARRIGIRDDARDEARRSHDAGQRHRARRHRRRAGRLRQSADREPAGARYRHRATASRPSGCSSTRARARVDASSVGQATRAARRDRR